MSFVKERTAEMRAQAPLKQIALLLFVLLSIPLQLLYAEKISVFENEELVVLFQGAPRAAAEEIAGIYPLVKKQVEECLRWQVHFRPTIVLATDTEMFQKMGGSDLIVAFAMPDRNLIVMDYSKVRRHPFTIEATLKHELCHLVLSDHIQKERLPRWFDEGIAQWVSGGIAEIMLDRNWSGLDRAILSGRTIRIRNLAERFPREKALLMLAYEESRSLVEYIISKYGVDGLLMVLHHLRQGEDIHGALLKALSISLTDLERAWYFHLKKKITWLSFLIHHVYEILFFLASIVMIYGFLRRFRQKKAYPDEEEDRGE
jgi:hypothetical protein